MRRAIRFGALAVWLGFAAAACSGEDLAQLPDAGREPPELLIRAPVSLESAAARVRAIDPIRLIGPMRLVGAERPGAPIEVVLALDDSELATTVPPWVVGTADGASSTVVLFPQRALTYPNSSLEELVAHEITHVMIARAAMQRPVPRWFHEGLATIAAGPWGLADRSRLSLALVSTATPSLARIERAFHASDQEAVSRAYGFAAAFVRDLLQRHGRDVAARILEGVRHGLPFDEAFAHATGTSLAGAEATFWRSSTLWYRWLIPTVASSAALWMVVTLLALWAFRRRRMKDAEVRERWEEELRAERRAERTDAVEDPASEARNVDVRDDGVH